MTTYCSFMIDLSHFFLTCKLHDSVTIKATCFYDNKKKFQVPLDFGSF